MLNNLKALFEIYERKNEKCCYQWQTTFILKWVFILQVNKYQFINIFKGGKFGYK